MTRVWIVALVAALGCSQPARNPPPPTTTEPTPGAGTGSAMCGAPNQGDSITPEQCTCLGGRVNASRGGEQEHCAPGEREIYPVRFGIEGGWCCKAQ